MAAKFYNLWSKNETESGWKWGTAVIFTAGTAAALILYQANWQPLLWFPKWPASLDVPHQSVLLVSCLSFAIFQFLHYWDGKNKNIRGLRGRLKDPKPDFGDYVSSAISRMSLQSGWELPPSARLPTSPKKIVLRGLRCACSAPRRFSRWFQYCAMRMQAGGPVPIQNRPLGRATPSCA